MKPLGSQHKYSVLLCVGVVSWLRAHNISTGEVNNGAPRGSICPYLQKSMLTPWMTSQGITKYSFILLTSAFLSPAWITPLQCVCVHVCVWVLSCVPSFATPWTVACQAPLSMGFPRQEFWSELSLPVPGDLPDLGIEPISLLSPALAGRFFTTVTPEKPLVTLDGPQLLISFQIALLRCVVRISNMTHGAASLQDGLKDLSSCPSHLALWKTPIRTTQVSGDQTLRYWSRAV